jgi:ubiquitin C-terminal hydrolase
VYSKYYKKGVCGLLNSRNSCFINAAIQVIFKNNSLICLLLTIDNFLKCLSNIQELTEFMIANKENFRRKSLSIAYANILEIMWCKKYEYVDIRPFKVNYK